MSEEQASGVVLARVRSSGLAVRYSERRLWLESVGELTPDQVRSRDDRGLLIWADAAARALFYANFPGPSEVTPVPQAPATDRPAGTAAKFAKCPNCGRDFDKTRFNVCPNCRIVPKPGAPGSLPGSVEIVFGFASIAIILFGLAMQFAPGLLGMSESSSCGGLLVILLGAAVGVPATIARRARERRGRDVKKTEAASISALAALADLRDRGAIDAAEYEARRSRL